MNNNNLLSIPKIAKHFGISIPTLKKTLAAHAGELDIIETDGGHKRLRVDQLEKILGKAPERDEEDDDDGTEPELSDEEKDLLDGLEISNSRGLSARADGIEYHVKDSTNKILGIWGIEPDSNQIRDSFGAGLFRVFAIDKRTQRIIGVTRHDLGEAPTKTETGGFGEMIENFIKFNSLSDKMRGGGGNNNNDLLLKMYEAERQNNQILLQLILKQATGGTSSGIKDFLESIEVARKLGIFGAAGAAGDSETPSFYDTLVGRLADVAEQVVPAIVEKMTGGKADAESGLLRLEPAPISPPQISLKRPIAAPVAAQGPQTRPAQIGGDTAAQVADEKTVTTIK